MRLLAAADYRVMPWKNGGGTTTELHVHHPSTDGFAWRVSIAEVGSDGPFSRFDGFDRHIMTIAGNGFILEGGPGGDIDVSRRYEPCQFPGEWPIHCRLCDGPSRDFNLMARRAGFESSLTIARGATGCDLQAGGGWIFAHVLAAAAATPSHILHTSNSLLLEPGERVALQLPQPAAIVAICTVTPTA